MKPHPSSGECNFVNWLDVPTQDWLEVRISWLYQARTKYSSLTRPSEKGTLYVRPPYKGHCLRSQKTTIPYSSMHWGPPRRGQTLYKGQPDKFILFPKCPFFGRSTVLLNVTFSNSCMEEKQGTSLFQLVCLSAPNPYICMYIVYLRPTIPF